MSNDSIRISSAIGMELGTRLSGSKTMSAKNRQAVRASETIEDALETGDSESSVSHTIQDTRDQSDQSGVRSDDEDSTGSILDITA